MGEGGSPFLKEWSSHSLSRGLVNKPRWQTPISTKSKSGSVFFTPSRVIGISWYFGSFSSLLVKSKLTW